MDVAGLGPGSILCGRGGVEIIGDYAMKKYTAKYYMKKFDTIPDEKWTTHTFMDASGACCALGHCMVRGDYIYSNSSEARGLQRQLGFGNVSSINDGQSSYRKLGDTPKERILNALILVEAGVWEEIV
jgi:hypothetical protein